MLLRLLRRIFSSPFKPLYDEAQLLPKLRRSLMMVICGNICGNICGVVTGIGGTALTGFAEGLGAGDFVFGVLNGIPLAAALAQIPAAMLVSKHQKRKRYMLTYGVFGRVMWIIIGLVPFFVPANPVWLRLWSVIFLVGISSISGSFINVCFNPWLADLLPISIRGRWMSLRDAINSVASVCVGLIVALVLDHIPGFIGYAIVFCIGGLFGVLDMLAFLPVQEVYKQPPVTIHLFKTAKRIFKDKTFFPFMLFWTAWCLTANISGPYINRYAISMGLSYMTVTLCSQVAAALTTISVIWLWGNLLDRYGNKPVLWVSCLFSAITPGFFLFATPGNFLPLLLHNMIGAFFWSGANLTATSMQLSCSPDDERPVYIAFFSCFTSLAGAFLGTLAGGALLEWVRNWINSGTLNFLGSMADPYKLVFLFSVITRLLIVIIFVSQMQNLLPYSTTDMLKGIGSDLAKKVRLPLKRR